MRLLNIQAQNLFGINEAIVEFRDGIATLVGPNGAGKSNILRIVDFFLRHYTSGQWIDKPHVPLKSGQKLEATEPSSIRLDFELCEKEASLFQKWRLLGLMQYLANNTKLNDYLLGFHEHGKTKLKPFQSAEELRDFWTQVANDFEKDAYGKLQQEEKRRYGHVSISAKTRAVDHFLLDIGHPLLLAPIIQPSVTCDKSEQNLLDKELNTFFTIICNALKLDQKTTKALEPEFRAKLLQYSMPALTGKSFCGITDAFQSTALEINRGWDVLREEYETREGSKPEWIKYSDFNTVMRLLIYNSVVSLPQDRGLLSTLRSQTNRYQGGTQLVLRNAIHLVSSRFLSMEEADQKKVEEFQAACRDLFGEGFEVRPVYLPTKSSDLDQGGLATSRQMHVSIGVRQGSMTAVRLEETSGGQIEAFLVLSALIFSNADTVLLDEPGYSLHPPMQAKLRRWMLERKQTRCQSKSILIVTHSVEMLSEETFHGIHHFMRKKKGKYYPSVVKSFTPERPTAEEPQQQDRHTVVPASASSIGPQQPMCSPRTANKFDLLRQLSSTAVDELNDDDDDDDDVAEEPPADDLEPTPEVSGSKNKRSKWGKEAKQAPSRARSLIFYDYSKGFTIKSLIAIIGKHTEFQDVNQNRLNSVTSIKHVDHDHIRVRFDDNQVACSVLENTKSVTDFNVRYETPPAWSLLSTTVVADKLDPKPQQIYLNPQETIFLLSPERKRLMFSTSVVFVEGVNDKRFLEAVLHVTSQSDKAGTTRGNREGIAWEPIVIDGCTAGFRAVKVARELGIPHVSLFDRDVVLQPKHFPDLDTTNCRKVFKSSPLYRSGFLSDKEKKVVDYLLPDKAYSGVKHPKDLEQCYEHLEQKHHILVWEGGDVETVVVSKETKEIIEREYFNNKGRQLSDKGKKTATQMDPQGCMTKLKEAAAKLARLDYRGEESNQKVVSTAAEVKSCVDRFKWSIGSRSSGQEVPNEQLIKWLHGNWGKLDWNTVVELAEAMCKDDDSPIVPLLKRVEKALLRQINPETQI